MVFGNLFQNRNNASVDYTKGLFYSGRVRMFRYDVNKVHPAGAMTSHSDVISTEKLLKPLEYRKQVKETAQKRVLFGRGRSFANLLRVNTPKIVEPPPRTASKGQSTSTIILENPNEEDAWCLEEYGGVKMWVNQRNGDVSVQNPKKKVPTRTSLESRFGWLIPHRRDSAASTASSNTQNKTGNKRSSVFTSENHEVQEAFDILNPKLALKLSVLEDITSTS